MTILPQLIRRAAWQWCATGTTLIAGCASHLHNAADYEQAQLAQQQMTELIQSHEAAFATMTTNLETLRESEAELFDEAARRHVEIQARVALRGTWNDLGSVQSAASEMKSEMDALAQEVAAEMGAANAEGLSTEEALNAAKSQLEAAQARITGWNRRVAAMEALIAVSPGLTSLSEAKNFDEFSGQVKSFAQTLGTTTVSYEDADGKTQKSNLKDELESIFDVNAVLQGGDKELGRVISTLRVAFVGDAPGLALTIAALALDLAQAERASAVATLKAITLRRELVQRADLLVCEGGELAEEADTMIGAVGRANDNVYESMLAMAEGQPEAAQAAKAAKAKAAEAKKAADEAAADGAADADAKAAAADAAADAADAAETEAMRAAQAALAVKNFTIVTGAIRTAVDQIVREYYVLKHRQSIDESRFVAAMHESLVRRGVEGLVVYHAGGVKPEEIADLVYKAAQLAILGIIAETTD